LIIVLNLLTNDFFFHVYQIWNMNEHLLSFFHKNLESLFFSFQNLNFEGSKITNFRNILQISAPFFLEQRP